MRSIKEEEVLKTLDRGFLTFKHRDLVTENAPRKKVLTSLITCDIVLLSPGSKVKAVSEAHPSRFKYWPVRNLGR
jgi:hypothetical protein